MKNKLTPMLMVIFLLSFPHNLYSGPVFDKENTPNHHVAKFVAPKINYQPFGAKTQRGEFVDKDDFYFLNTGKKKSFLRKKNTYAIIFNQKKTSGLHDINQIQDKIKNQLGNRLDIIKGHRLRKNIMFRVKKGERPEDIISTLLQTDPSIDFISPVLTGKTKGGELAVVPRVVVSIEKDENPDSVIAELQDQYNLSLMNKLSYTETEFEFRIEEQLSDIGRIFEITREIAQLPYINWVEPNLLVSPIKYFTPNDTYFNNQWHLHNTGQNGAAVDADIDAPEGWDISRGNNTVVAIFDDGVDTSHEDLVIWSNPGETGSGKETNGIDDDGNGYIDDYQGWDFGDGDNDPSPVSSSDNHGTAVAGVAGARGNNSQGVTGSATDTVILPVRSAAMICSDWGNAMRYAGKHADVVNNSWGISACESQLNTAISSVVNGNISGARRGVLGAPVLFASGNDASGWKKFTVPVTAGTHSFEWFFLKSASDTEGYDTMWLDDITWPGGSTTNFESDTIGSIPSGFISGSNNPIGITWSVVSDGVHARGASGKSVKAGTISHNNYTWLVVPSKTVSAGDLVFWVWVSSEQYNDYFQFQIDGSYEFHDYPGQYGHHNEVGYPASNPDTIAVGASNDGGPSGLEERSHYSQFGSDLDVVAPSSGGDQGIYTTDRMGGLGYDTSNYYDSFSGTSSATPLVAGIVANLISYDPTLTAAELLIVLQDGCDQIGPYAYPGERNGFYGYGRVNLLNSLNILACEDEVCDGVDNNCDEVIDEGGDALCVDSNLCNGSETCDGVNGCQPGSAPDCDDNNPCTTNSCIPLTGCENTPIVVGLIGDINLNGRVDGLDLSHLARAFGATFGTPRYDCKADLDFTDLVDGDDLSLMAANFGQTTP